MTDLSSWLDANGLAKHADTLVENDIDLDVVAELTDADLRDLGLSLGDRKRFLAAARMLVGTPVLGESSVAIGDPGPAPVPVDGSVADSRRQVTVLFADLSGFTTLASRLDPEEVHALLQRYFAVVDETVHAYGGSIDKHIGDAVMAVFGAPKTHTDDPERAVRTALDIHRRLTDFTPPLIAHIGIASGQVVASRTGSAAFDEYTVTGASVNLASRLQDLAGPGDTLVSDAVRSALVDVAAVETAGEAVVKGFETPIAVWRVLHADLRLEQLNPDDDPERPFVGRRRELGQLIGVLEQTRNSGSGQAVLLRGEAGIGKTRLVDRFQAEAARSGFRCHTGLVLDFGVGKGREAIPALVRSLIGIQQGADKAGRRAAADRALDDGLIAGTGAVHLNDLLDLPQPPSLREAHDAMDHATRMLGVRRTVASLIAETARRSPVLIRVEDIHWADAILLDRLAGIAAAIVDRPAVMVMTTRLEGDPIDGGWRAGARDCPLTTIDLGPLTEQDASQLARRYLDANQALAKACIERAAGNPLFLDQLLRNAEGNAERGVPGSVQSIVQARMDHLEPKDRAAVEAAAVLGQRFSAETVAYLIDDPTYDCRSLVAHNLARPEGDEFLFVHALVRDGVYATLLRPTRRALHARAAEWFQARDPALHARHLDAADDPQASAAFIAAARQDLAALRYAPALGFAEDALRLARQDDARVDALCLKGEVLALLGDSAGSIQCFETALADTGDPGQSLLCRLGMAAGMRILDRFEEAFDQLDHAEALARSLDDGDRLAEVAYQRGNLYFPLGRTEECMAAHSLALDQARRSGSNEIEVQALGGLADACYAQSRIKSAFGYFTDCVARARAAGFPRIAVANAPMIAWTQLLSGDFRLSLDALREAQALAAAAGNDRAMIIVLNGLSFRSLECGLLDDAEAESREIVRLSELLSSDRFLSYGYAMLAQVEHARDRVDQATEAVEHALAAAEGAAIGFVGPWALGFAARLAADPELARVHLAKGEALLGAGAVAHNHFGFRRAAIEYGLEHGLWDLVGHHADALKTHLGDEGTRWSDFIVTRARALAAIGQGADDTSVRKDLERCLEYGSAEGLAEPSNRMAAALASLS